MMGPGGGYGPVGGNNYDQQQGGYGPQHGQPMAGGPGGGGYPGGQDMGGQQDMGGGMMSGAAGGMGRKNLLAQTNMLFFVASCCVVIAAFIGTFETLLTVPMNPMSLIDEIYLFAFGGMMFVLDAPLNFKILLEVKAMVCKYVSLLTRFTGRGIWYVFLGTMTFGSLWRVGFFFLAVIFGFYVFGLGVYAAGMGAVKSRKLERLRRTINRNYGQNLNDFFVKYASAPRAGMTKAEFSAMSLEVAGIAFEGEEVSYVFNALCPRSVNVLHSDDLQEWCISGMAVL